ncbi:MAG TPA: hypothetical protein VGD40_22725 [Chryseosolibacter sp.]
MAETDITRSVISNETIRQRIGAIFPDSLILDNKLRFVSISQNILEATGYTMDELRGHSLAIFSCIGNLHEEIKKRLRKGYFEEERFDIRSKNSTRIAYGISGFYLGLIADLSGMIVLKFKNLEEINLMYAQLDAKTEELDRFVYLSSHALRGPLATIQGLLNLTRLSDDINEIKQLNAKIETFAARLDDKLHRLILFAESDKGFESGNGPLGFQTICELLHTEMQESAFGQCARLSYKMQEPFLLMHHGHTVLSLMRNLLNFICSLEKTSDNQLVIDALGNSSAVEIIIRAKGFKTAQGISEKLQIVNFGYSEILSYPELVNCYAAKKIVFKLKGSIQFIVIPPAELVVLITLPRPENSGNQH